MPTANFSQLGGRYPNLESFESKSLDEVIKFLRIEKSMLTWRRALRFSSGKELDALIVTPKDIILIEVKKTIGSGLLPRLAVNFREAEAELRTRLKLEGRTSKWIVSAIESSAELKEGSDYQIQIVILKETKWPENFLL